MLENQAVTQTPAIASPADGNNLMPKNHKSYGFINTTMIEIGAGVMSIAAGAAAAWEQVTEQAYKNFSQLDAFAKTKAERIERFQHIKKQQIEHKITLNDAFKQVDSLIEETEGDVNKTFADAGVDTLTKKWQILRGHQKVKTVIYAGAALGLSLVALIPIGRSLFTKEEKDEINEKADKQQADLPQGRSA